MKKRDIRPDPFIPFRGIRLFREDVEYLIDLMKSGGSTLRIEDTRHVFESLDEYIKTRGTRPDSLNISTEDSEHSWKEMNLYFRQDRVHFFSPDDSEIYYQGKAFLESKCHRVPHVLTSPLPWIVLSPFILVMAAISIISNGTLPATIFWLSALMILLLLLSTITRRAYFGVRLTYRYQGGFFKRHGERIILMLIGALIGAIVTKLVAWIL